MPAAFVCDAPAETNDVPLWNVACDATQRARLYQLLGPFCHQCRNHLNSLKLSLFLARRSVAVGDRGDWNEPERQYRALEHVVDRLQQICRPMHLTPVRLPLALLWDEVFPVWTGQLGLRGIDFEPVAPAEPAVGDFDPMRLRPALDALAEWRAAAAPAEASITFSWRLDDDWIDVEWSESSSVAGLAAQDRSDAFVLPLLARVMTAHGGIAECAFRPSFRVRLRWPSAIRVHE